MDNQYSVVTIVHKRTRPLYNLVRQLESSDFLPSEVIVVWMGPPCSESLLTSSRFDIQHKFIANDHLPVAKARNKGFNCCSNSQVVYLDVDCVFPPNLTTALLSTLRPGRVVNPKVHYLPEITEDQEYTELLQAATSIPRHSRVPLHTPVSFNYFRALAFAIHRRDFQATGGFDEAFSGIGAVDIDFATRCTMNGYQLFKVAPIAIHPSLNKLAPPILHVCDIVTNAARFKQKWGNYPMRACLRELVDAGLINEDYDQAGLRVKRMPTPEEIDAKLAS